MYSLLLFHSLNNGLLVLILQVFIIFLKFFDIFHFEVLNCII